MFGLTIKNKHKAVITMRWLEMIGMKGSKPVVSGLQISRADSLGHMAC